jgi:hypothetical protein
MLAVTNERVYFQPYHNLYEEQVVNFKIKSFVELFKRRFKLCETGLQLTLKPKKNKQQRTCYLTFATQEGRDAVYDAIAKYLPASCITDSTDIGVYTYEWAKGNISNFDYL